MHTVMQSENLLTALLEFSNLSMDSYNMNACRMDLPDILNNIY